MRKLKKVENSLVKWYVEMYIIFLLQIVIDIWLITNFKSNI